MKKYKKIITGLILGLICAILPFVGVAKVKALTVDDITTADDLKYTTWVLNENINIPRNTVYFGVNNVDDTITVAYYTFNNTTIDLKKASDANWFFLTANNFISGANSLSIYTPTKIEIYTNGNFNLDYGNTRKIQFLGFDYTETNGISFLKNNATFTGVVEPEPTARTIPFRIRLITNVFGDELEDINSSLINLPVYDDTVSFTVTFENNKMINGQIEHPESADELGELIFSNGERVFYTIYYNETNIDFKLYFYGEQLFLYEAVMYNTEVLDSGGNYQATVSTYSEGISEQEMQTLKNSGIYEASFDITIPQEEELVTDAQLMLEIGILEGSEPPGFDNITNIMTGIFTLVSSFLSIQLGFITLGQIIGLILAIGVIFFIFYVWNGGRNGN